MLLQPPVFFETEPLLSILKGLCVWEILGGSFSCDIASCGLRPGPWATSQTFTGKGFLSSRAKDHTPGARVGKASGNDDGYLPGSWWCFLLRIFLDEECS